MSGREALRTGCSPETHTDFTFQFYTNPVQGVNEKVSARGLFTLGIHFLLNLMDRRCCPGTTAPSTTDDDRAAYSNP